MQFSVFIRCGKFIVIFVIVSHILFLAPPYLPPFPIRFLPGANEYMLSARSMELTKSIIIYLFSFCVNEGMPYEPQFLAYGCSMDTPSVASVFVNSCKLECKHISTVTRQRKVERRKKKKKKRRNRDCRVQVLRLVRLQREVEQRFVIYLLRQQNVRWYYVGCFKATCNLVYGSAVYPQLDMKEIVVVRACCHTATTRVVCALLSAPCNMYIYIYLYARQLWHVHLNMKWENARRTFYGLVIT